MIYTSNKMIEDADGNILLTIKQDQTDVATNVQHHRDTGCGWSGDRTMRMAFSVPAQEYHEWGRKLGYECWQEDDFLAFFKNHAPQFAIGA